jgi:antitoxin (DNA-binding transcriptional repressor) of toxin-antitoxin stability system
MESRLSQVSVRAGDRIALADDAAQRTLSESLERITAGRLDQLRGPIPLPATEEHGAAVAYLVPVRGAAQDLFGCETTLLMIRPAHSENRLKDLVRARFAIDAGEAQRWVKLIASASPRLAAALLASSESVQAALDGALGRTQSREAARMGAFLWQLSNDLEYGSTVGQAEFLS